MIRHVLSAFIDRRVTRTSEVADLEHISSTLTRRRDELRCVDLSEPVRDQELSEQHARRRLNLEDRLVGCGAQLDHSVIQALILAHDREFLATR